MGNKYTGMISEVTLFTSIKHRINNTGWMMKWWWREGVERNAGPRIERMLNIFNLHFPAPEEKAVSRICASKTRRNLQTFGWCLQFKQSCPWASLFYFCARKTSREINAVGRIILRKNVSESSALPILFEGGESPCNLNSLILPQKKHNLFCKTGLKKRGMGEKRKSVTTSP